VEKTESAENEAENTSGEVLLSDLEYLLTDKEGKAKSFEEVEGLLSEFFSRENISPENQKSAIAVLFEAEPKILADFFEKHWEKVPDQVKDKILQELYSLTAEKGALRQAIAAQSFAEIDRENSSRLVFHIINNGEKSVKDDTLPQLPKYKEDILNRHFFSDDNRWIPFATSDEDTLRGLLLHFVATASITKNFGREKSVGFALNFVRWALSNLRKVSLKSETAHLIEETLSQIINRLPENAQKELRELRDANETAVQEKTVSDGSQKKEENNFKKKIPENNQSKEQVINDKSLKPGSSENVKKADPRAKNKISKSIAIGPEQLLEQKQEARMRLDEEIEVLTKLISERDQLREKSIELKERLDRAYDQADKDENRIESLKGKVTKLETALTESEANRSTALEIKENLSRELTVVREKLESQSSALKAEREEFSESSQRDIENEMKYLKGKLQQKLRPIFETKRGTDELPNSEKLAEFLRGWFKQIEDVLNNQDIKP
jgi:hypothetical protein